MGFPVHQKYEAKNEQLIDMSKYISAPFLVERVSFEFGAAIEDSGPHSLGYIKPTIKTDDIDADKRYPAIQATPLTGNPPFENLMMISRSPFINGSIVAPSHMFSTAYNATKTFTSSSAHALGAICATDNGFGLESRPSNIKLQDRVAGVNARSFLKTQTGPRGKSQSTSERKLLDPIGVPKPASYIPVLAGGVNGVVTGSRDVFLQDGTGGPHLILEPNLENSFMTQKTWFTGSMAGKTFENHGGTPFWRADTFFLLRQAPVAAKPKPVAYNIVAGYDMPMLPELPYSGYKSVRSQKRFTTNRDNFGKNLYTDEGSITVLPTRGNTAVVLSPTPISSSTTREIITFGQMAHYGYTNAYDSYMEPIWDSHQDLPQASSSINSTFQSQLFSGDLSQPQHKGKVKLPLFGQAMKYAAYPDFSWASIPVNAEAFSYKTVSSNAKKTDISLFSDLPDSYQSQTAYFPTHTLVPGTVWSPVSFWKACQRTLEANRR